MTRGSYFDTRALYFGSFLELRARPAEPVGHFGSLSGKRYEKGHKWTSNWSSKGILNHGGAWAVDIVNHDFLTSGSPELNCDPLGPSGLRSMEYEGSGKAF